MRERVNSEWTVREIACAIKGWINDERTMRRYAVRE